MRLQDPRSWVFIYVGMEVCWLEIHERLPSLMWSANDVSRSQSEDVTECHLACSKEPLFPGAALSSNRNICNSLAALLRKAVASFCAYSWLSSTLYFPSPGTISFSQGKRRFVYAASFVFLSLIPCRRYQFLLTTQKSKAKSGNYTTPYNTGTFLVSTM